MTQRERLILKRLVPYVRDDAIVMHICEAKYNPALALGAHLHWVLTAMTMPPRRVKS